MMNFYIVSLLDALAEHNLPIFCNLNFVNSAALFSDFDQISERFESVTDFYFSFLRKLEFIPYKAFVKNHYGYYDFTNVNGYDLSVNEVMNNLSQKKIVNNELMPVKVRFTDTEKMHLLVGFFRIEHIKNGFLHVVDLCLPKNEIKNIPSGVSYVKEILDSYIPNEKQTLREFIETKGFNYNHFQRDSKICFGDSFYSFWLKGKMIDAAGDIIFTPMSLKEIAFKNKFLDYQNMYKTFHRYGVGLPTIPRLANL